MGEQWLTETGMTRDEFTRITLYLNKSDNRPDNRNRAVILGFTDEGILVAPGAVIRLGGQGRIGRNTFVGLYTYINGEVIIGEHVLIGPHCSITAGNHVFSAETRAFTDRTPKDSARVVIGDRSWLASGSMVTAGVEVGCGNLICANAVVTCTTADYAIMAGVPARQVGRIDPQSGQYTWFSQNGSSTGEEGDK